MTAKRKSRRRAKGWEPIKVIPPYPPLSYAYTPQNPNPNWFSSRSDYQFSKRWHAVQLEEICRCC